MWSNHKHSAAEVKRLVTWLLESEFLLRTLGLAMCVASNHVCSIRCWKSHGNWSCGLVNADRRDRVKFRRAKFDFNWEWTLQDMILIEFCLALVFPFLFTKFGDNPQQHQTFKLFAGRNRKKLIKTFIIKSIRRSTTWNSINLLDLLIFVAALSWFCLTETSQQRKQLKSPLSPKQQACQILS